MCKYLVRKLCGAHKSVSCGKNKYFHRDESIRVSEWEFLDKWCILVTIKNIFMYHKEISKKF